MMLITAVLMLANLSAQPKFVEHAIAIPHPSSGASLDGWKLYSWGDGVSAFDLRNGRVHVLRKDRFGPAGCIGDVDSDGAPDLVLHALPDRLVWLKGPAFRTMNTIDSGVDFSDCRVATILGHRGILLTHRGMQVRFYEAPVALEGRWPYREIYSFYTASHQAGLLMHDVNGDGRPDLLSGNYWIQSPESFELPWRLFAINTYNDTPEAAHVRMAPLPLATGFRLVVSQAELHPAKLAIFSPPPDPQQLWIEQRLDTGLALNQPSALAAGDVDGDGTLDFVLAERAGSKPRIWLWRGLPDGSFQTAVIHTGTAVHSVFVSDMNGDGRNDIVVAGPSRSFWLETVPVK